MPTLVQIDFSMDAPWGSGMAAALGEPRERDRRHTGAPLEGLGGERLPEGFGISGIRARVLGVDEPLTEFTGGSPT